MRDEWNTNTGDVMVIWFTSYANFVMSQWACMSHVHMHGACAIIEMGTLKYSNGLMGMPADPNLRKLTASHFNVLITQNANKNMENLVWGKQEPLVHPYMFWYTTKGEKAVKTSFYFIYDFLP